MQGVADTLDRRSPTPPICVGAREAEPLPLLCLLCMGVREAEPLPLLGLCSMFIAHKNLLTQQPTVQNVGTNSNREQVVTPCPSSCRVDEAITVQYRLHYRVSASQHSEQ